MNLPRNSRFTLCDTHVHTFRSHDGRSALTEYCAMANSLGIRSLGVAEHKDFDPDDPVVNHYDYQSFWNDISAAREAWGERVEVLAGVELDYQYWFEPELVAWHAGHHFDFVITSVHHIDRRMLMTEAYREHYGSAHNGYAAYYEAVFQSIRSGAIDVVGHLNYVNKRGVAAYGAWALEKYTSHITTLLAEMIRRDVALEVNTAGLRHPVRTPYPDWSVVELYYRMGGRLITLGSDAHTVTELSHRFNEACAMLWQIGFRELTLFRGRQPQMVPLVETR